MAQSSISLTNQDRFKLISLYKSLDQPSDVLETLFSLSSLESINDAVALEEAIGFVLLKRWSPCLRLMSSLPQDASLALSDSVDSVVKKERIQLLSMIGQLRLKLSSFWRVSSTLIPAAEAGVGHARKSTSQATSRKDSVLLTGPPSLVAHLSVPSESRQNFVPIMNASYIEVILRLIEIKLDVWTLKLIEGSKDRTSLLGHIDHQAQLLKSFLEIGDFALPLPVTLKAHLMSCRISLLCDEASVDEYGQPSSGPGDAGSIAESILTEMDPHISSLTPVEYNNILPMLQELSEYQPDASISSGPDSGQEYKSSWEKDAWMRW